MKKIIGIRSLALTCCAIGVLTSGQAWAIDNCTQVTAQNEADADSVANDKTGADNATTFNNILTAYNADPDDTSSQVNDDEDCAPLTVNIIHDFGDAPDSYGTTVASGGAQHEVVSWLKLGPSIDDETDGFPSAPADGDDADNTDDEDGVSIPPMTAGQVGPVITLSAPTNTSGADAYVACWIDYDVNGTFDAGEFGSVTVPDGNAIDLTITMPDVPAGVPTGDALGTGIDTYARCRLSNTALTDADGAGIVNDTTGIADGEVEDYPVNFDKFDLALIKTVQTGQAATFNPGDTVVFEINVENQGSLDATGIIITDYIPSGLTLVAGNGWTSPDGGITAVLDTAIDLSAGATTAAPIEISFTVDNDATIGTLTNAAEISTALDAVGNPVTDVDSTPDDTPDVDTTDDPIKDNVTDEDGKNVTGEDEDDHDIATITLAELVDLELSKEVMNRNGTASITEAFRGDEVMYVLTVTNNGPSDATGVVINDALPDGVTFVGIATEDGSGGYDVAVDDTVYDSDSASATYGNWNVGNIPGPVSNGGTPGTATLRIVVSID